MIEFWIENSFMLELLTQEMTADYLAFMDPTAYCNFLTQADGPASLQPVTA
ncbi:MAG: hypothetical protein HC800_21700 [Phormidesmis sp. RL_2_1]|nr:hypothetical protein [Phormidesmis sp. RL_2_1]